MASFGAESNKGGKSAERLFPFVARARLLLVGRDTLARNKRHLQCVLISEDISEGSRAEILRDFANYPVIQRYSSAQFEEFFGVRNAKVLGLKKSSLAKSIYSELKEFRLNKPPPGAAKPGAAQSKSG
jgi:hypothetical protein